MLKQFFEDLSTNRADVNVGIFLLILGLLIGVLHTVVKKNMTAITNKFNEVGKMPFKNVIKYSFLYIVPIVGLAYTIYDNYDKPYNFKTNLSIIIIFASLIVIFLLDFIIPIYNMLLKILDNNRQSFDIINDNNKLLIDEIVELKNEVDELKKRLS